MKIPFKNSFLSWLMKKRMPQIELFLKYPFQVQEDVLFNLLLKAKNTEFGTQYGFSSIKTYTDFKNQIPIKNYEELFPYIRKLRMGYENVLWPGETRWFAKSAGTTNAKSKFIPISEIALIDCHYKAGKDMLAIYCHNHSNTKLFNGKGLMLGGSQNIQTSKNYIEGDLSAILLDNFPFWVNMHRIPDLQTALHPIWKEKLKQIVKQGIQENVTSLTGAPSWMLIILQKILLETKTKNISEVWPNLELYMHGGMNFSPYKEQFKKLIPSKEMNYMECYNASEGSFAIQDQTHNNEMLLMLDYGIFYEFIDMKDLKNGSKDAIGLDEVKLGNTYAIVISTNAGLWRYLIGDTIAFTSLSPFRIKIIGRTKSFINAFGEELVIENAEIAIQEACKNNNAIVKEFTAAPLYIDNKNSGAHQWLIEFEKQPNDLNAFTLELDKVLKNINSDYKAKRTNDFILKLPKVQVAKTGTFYTWLKKKEKLGGQNKIPRLNNHRRIIEDIINLN
jgi:hypothetical protein